MSANDDLPEDYLHGLPPEIVRLIDSFGGLRYIHNLGRINKDCLKHANSLKARITETYTKKAFGAILESFRSEPGSKEFAGLYDRVCGHLKYRIELWRFNILSNKVSSKTDAGMDATQILSACFSSLACATTHIHELLYVHWDNTYYDSPSTYNRLMLLGYAFANGICDKPGLEAECKFQNPIAGQRNTQLNFKLSDNCHTQVEIRYQPQPDGHEDDDTGLHLSRSYIHLKFGYPDGTLALWMSYPGQEYGSSLPVNKDLLRLYAKFEDELTSLKDTLVKCMKITDTDIDSTSFTRCRNSSQTPWKAAVMWVHVLQFIERYQPLVDNDTIMVNNEEEKTEIDLVSIAFMRETGYPFEKPPVDPDGTERQILFRSSFLDTALFV